MQDFKQFCRILTFKHSFPISAKELAENSHVQDAFVIAVEQQAKERLERLSALRRIKPVDMTKLSQQVNTNDIDQAKSFCASTSKVFWTLERCSSYAQTYI